MEADHMLVKAETGVGLEAGLCQLSEAATDLLLRPDACYDLPSMGFGA